MTVRVCVHSDLPASPVYTPSFQHLLRDDSGQDLIEYALVATCIGLGTVTGIHGLAASIASYLNIVGNGFTNAVV